MEPNRELTFFISPDGNDQWSGKLSEPNSERTDGPLATLEHAREIICAYKATKETAATFTNMLRGGIYYLPNTLVLSEEDSGTRDHPITWCAFPSETPILSGGYIIDGWELEKGNIRQAKNLDSRFFASAESATFLSWSTPT